MIMWTSSGDSQQGGWKFEQDLDNFLHPSKSSATSASLYYSQVIEVLDYKGSWNRQ